MALRRPLTIRNGKVAEATDAETAFAALAAVREYALNPSVLINQTATGTSIGTLTDTRRFAGVSSTSTTAFVDSDQLAQTSVDTVTSTPLHQNKQNPALNPAIPNPLYWDASTGKVREMTDQDFYDTYIAPAFSYMTSDSSNELFVGGTYFVSTSSISLSNSTIISSTPFYVDTRADITYYGAGGAWTSNYEVIGAGGGGGGGIGGGAGSAGTSSSISFVSGGNTVTITSAGGAGGAGSAQTGWGDGENSFYGAGGAAGASSDSNRQTSGSSPAPTAYGAGGGGGGANPFAARNGGIGGKAGGLDGASYTVTAWNSSATLQRFVGMPNTATVSIDPGTTITVTVGTGGAGGTGGGTNGARGAHGYVKFTVNGQDYTYTTPGTYTFDLSTIGNPSDLPKAINVTSANQNYYLHRYNPRVLSSVYYVYSPIYWDYSNNRFKQSPTAEWTALLAQYIRHHASTKLNYTFGNSGDAGVNKGSAITDTRSDSQIYTTDFNGLDDYVSQMLPSNTTINTYDVKYLKLNLI